MTFHSSYELKKFLKRKDIEFDGFQAHEFGTNGSKQYFITPLGEVPFHWDAVSHGFIPDRSTPEDAEIIARLNGFLDVFGTLKANVKVGVYPETAKEEA